MGELFTSFDDAWSFFLGRKEPLEDFLEDFSEAEDAYLEGWLIEPPAHVKLAAGRIQSSLSHLPSLAPIPDHFLHVWIGRGDRIGEAWERWRAVEPFSIRYGRVNCFHSAVVVEVEGPVRRLISGTPNDLATFLPHMTVAVVRESSPPGSLRDTLLFLRDSVLGEQLVHEVKRVRFPAGRTTVLRPWTVEQLVSLR